MKKIILISALAFYGIMNAQTSKKSWIISSGIGYFIIDNLAIGLDLRFNSIKKSFNSQSTDVNYKQTNSTLTLLPNVAYYFPTASDFRPYIGAGIGYGSTNSSGLLWGAKGGLVYLLNNSIGLDIGIAYSNLSTSEIIDGTKMNVKTGNFGINAGISVFIGK